VILTYIIKIIRRNRHSKTDIARLTNVNRHSVYNWLNYRVQLGR
jgi:DNA invertase Pin-like site-specific DNA recombinase